MWVIEKQESPQTNASGGFLVSIIRCESAGKNRADLKSRTLLHGEQTTQQSHGRKVTDGGEGFHEHQFHFAARARNGYDERFALLLADLLHRVEPPII